MSEYAIVKSFLSCLSSSFVFSLNLNKDRTYVRLIVDNLRQAIDYQGLSASTEELLYNVIEHLKSFVEGYIDSTQLDFLIDETRREIWRTKDCGIRVFVARPNVNMQLLIIYSVAVLPLCRLSLHSSSVAIVYTAENNKIINSVAVHLH